MNYDLKRRFIFGVSSSNVGNHVSFFEDNSIAYLAGNSVVVQNLITYKQRFVHSREDFQILGLVAEGNGILIVMEESKQYPFNLIISTYDSALELVPESEFRIQVDDKCASTSVTHQQPNIPLCIQRGTSFIATILKIAEDQIKLFCWSKDGTLLIESCLDSDILSDSNMSMSFHHNKNLLCVQSSHRFWQYKLIESKGNLLLRLVNSPHDYEFEESLTCHDWIPESETCLLFGKDDGSVLVTEGGIVTSTIHVGYPIKSILGLHSGFVVGGPHTSCNVYSKSKCGVDFFCLGSISIKVNSMEKTASLDTMVLSPSCGKVCMFLSDINEIYTFDLSYGLDLKEESFSLVASSHKNVHSIAKCPQKSIMLSAGIDKTIRCWDYVTGKQRFCIQYNEIPSSISLHPTGLHAIISFPDEVRCVHVLIDELKKFWNIRLPRRMSSICTFSKGGHKFAISHDNLIQIYDFYTGKISQELKGHNYKISQVQWSNRDSEIIAIDEDGVINRWDVFGTRILVECVRYKAKPELQCILVDHNAIWIMSEGIIEILSPLNFEVKKLISMEKKWLDWKIVSTAVAYNDSSITIIGMKATTNQSKSMIRVLDSGSDDFVELSFLEEIDIVDAMDNLIFIKSQSHTIHIMELLIASKTNTLITQDSTSYVDTCTWFNHSLVSEMNLEEKCTTIDGLVSMSRDLISDHQYRHRLQEMNNDEEVFDLHNELDNLKCKCTEESEIGKTQIKNLEKQHKKFLDDQMMRHQDQLLMLENNHSFDLLQRFELHNVEKLGLDRKLEETNALTLKITQQLENRLAIIKKTLIKKKREREIMTLNLKNEIAAHQREFVERMKQLEHDIDTHLCMHKNNYEKTLSHERQLVLKDNSENEILGKRTMALIQNIEDQKEVIKQLLYKEELHKEEIKGLKNSISSLSIVIKKRHKILSSKQETRARFKTRQDELTKLSALDERIKELNTYASNDEAIQSTKKDIIEKEAMIHVYRSEHNDIEKLISFRKHQVESKKKQLMKQANYNRSLDCKLDSMKGDLSSCLILIKQPKKLQLFLENTKYIGKHHMGDKAIGRKEGVGMKELETSLKAINMKLQNQTAQENQELMELREYNQKLLCSIRKQPE